MYLKPATIEDIPEIYKPTKFMKMIDSFADSTVPVMELMWDRDEYKSAASVCSSLGAAIKRARRGITVVRRGDRVFLVKDTDGSFGKAGKAEA